MIRTRLAEFRDPRVKASEEQIAQSLEGNWQEDLLFVLKQEQDGYEFCRKQMAECDRQLAQYLQQREDRSQGAPLPEETRKGRLKKKKGNAPHCIDVMTAMTVISEAGWDEQMEDRGPFCFLAAALPGQSHQRR